MTVSDALDRYIAASAARWKPTTVATCTSYARARIKPALGSLDTRDVTRAHIESFMAGLSAKPNLANRCGGLLSGFFRWCEDRDLREEGANPCIGTQRYKVRGRKRFLSDEEYHMVWRALAALEKHKPCQVACIRLLILTGCRQTELRGLRWADYRDGTLHLRDAKAGPRTVWMCSMAREILDDLKPAGEALPEYVFSNPGGKPWGFDWIYQSWARVLERAGLDGERVRIHDLRHSYASFALREGETVVTIGRLLGHRDSATTLGYTHWHDSAAADAARLAGEALAA